jgi:DNA invertase Pin-like site-specific DNA recombinase
MQQVTAHHLSRLACLYVRQSTLQQVFENTESTSRQYALRERALALGWNEERIVVIDQDLGYSGASTADRLGFQRLVAEVGLGQVGLVLGLEVSRLARNSSDWHHLLEICALTHTLILDEEGLYDPSTFNDRLLLGLKGTMSEAELFVLRARLQGGIRNYARRGALKLTLPIGFIYTETNMVVLDPERPRASQHSRGLSQFCAHRLSLYDGAPLSKATFALPSPPASWSASRRTGLGRDRAP